MKKWFFALLSATVVSALSSATDIADARKEGRYINIYDSAKRKIATIAPAIGSDIDLLGVTTSFIVIKEGDYFSTYDADGKKIASLRDNGNMVFEKAVGSQFFILDGKKPNIYRRTYDRNCHPIGSGERVQ